MSESGYPDNYDFEAEGKATLEGKLISINAVTALKFGTTDTMVEKFVANIEDTEGTTWAVWLDSAVLSRAFRDEAKNRKAIGKTFEPNEGITIEYLGKRKGAKYTYKDFKVTFEFAAPSISGFDALASSDEVGQMLEEELATASQPEPEAVAASSSPQDDDIPF